MTTKITMNGVASYKNPAILETDKKVTLVYGLNGTGKSTLSNYLLDRTDPIFVSCSVEGCEDAEIYVYNNRFVKDNFHEMDKLKGIFTLAKSNKLIDEELIASKEQLKISQKKKEAIDASLLSLAAGLALDKERATEVTWKIKTQFAGGDRVLEYCLDGLKGKSRLFDYLAGINLENVKPAKTISDLKKEAESLQGENAKAYSKLPKLSINLTSIEEHLIFNSAIVGNQDSSIAGLIKRLSNADWVNEGISFMQILQNEGSESCPFCQSKTITNEVADAIEAYFDETFTESVKKLNELLQSYAEHTATVPPSSFFFEEYFPEEKKKEFDALYGQLLGIFSSNVLLIQQKIKSPSNVVSLSNSAQLIKEINQIVDLVNEEIEIHNKRVNSKKKSLEEIKTIFWKICRWDYDQTIAPYKVIETDVGEKVKAKNIEATSVGTSIAELSAKISTLQKQTINVDAAIAVINSKLDDLGIDSFKIIKHGENSYRLSRNGVAAEDFQSLSEGEKTVISFVYFVELCKGKRSAEDIADKKIVVVDDPISSLSHIYVFNIGQMLKQELFNSDQFDKIIVLTHSLYFFYELTDIKKERRDITQKLLRLMKNAEGSKIVDMKYEEIQNDYQSYWSVVTDDQQPPALIANCMRNIIEYFFNFIRKHDLNNVFQNPKLADPKYQAFYRFMNRESHSLGQNIFDYKEFDYARFQEAFKLVFEETGFGEHYKAMTR